MAAVYNCAQIFGCAALCPCRKGQTFNVSKIEPESGDAIARHVTTWKTVDQGYEDMWIQWERAEGGHVDFLKIAEIAPDGGLNSVEMQGLWGDDVTTKLTRVWLACQLTICIVYNIYYVVSHDIEMLEKDYGGEEGGFLIGRDMYESVFGLFSSKTYMAKQLVVGIELVILGCLFLCYLFNLVMIAFSRHPRDFWYRVSLLFTSHLPSLSSFTAMQLLYYVNPAVLIENVLLEISFLITRWRHGYWLLALWKFSWYILSRAVCFVVGVDAFLVKFRVTGKDYVYQPKLDFEIFVATAVFLNQLLSVVNVKLVVKHRLFEFVFGGADAAISTEDRARELFWRSMFAQQLWEAHSWWRFLIIILNVSDQDMQKVILRTKTI